MNLWPLNDDQVFRLTVFLIVTMAIAIPLFLFILRQDAIRDERGLKKQEFERLRIKRKRT